jgi:hypothetical protein
MNVRSHQNERTLTPKTSLIVGRSGEVKHRAETQPSRQMAKPSYETKLAETYELKLRRDPDYAIFSNPVWGFEQGGDR